MKKQSILCLLLATCMLSGCAGGQNATQQKDFEKGIEKVDKADYKNAIKYFDSALKISSSVSSQEEDIVTYKAAAQYLSGDYKGAIKSASNLINYDGKNSDYYYLRGSFYADQKDFEKADKDYKKAVSLSKNDYNLCFEIYENLVSHESTVNPEKYLDKVIAFDSKDGEIVNAKGDAYLYKGNTKEALEYYEKAVKTGYSTGYLGMAKCYYLDKDSKRASKEIKNFESKEKDSPFKFNKAAEALMQIKDYKSALSSVQKGLDLKKDNHEQDLKKNEIICYEYLGQFDKAKSKAKSYVKEYPGDHTMLREWKFLSTR